MAGQTRGCARRWSRPKLGLKHVRWERAALVTDVDWMRHLSWAFGWLVPGDLRSFAVAELDRAKACVAEGEGPTSA
jgi:SpoIIAA-like